MKKNWVIFLWRPEVTPIQIKHIQHIYIDRSICQHLKSGCSRIWQIWDFVKTVFYVFGPETDEQNCTMKIKVCNSWTFTYKLALVPLYQCCFSRIFFPHKRADKNIYGSFIDILRKINVSPHIITKVFHKCRWKT